MKEPLVSIGLPVYNGEKYLAEAIDSLLDQSFADFELVISDNASTDSTFRICQEYARKDNRIRLYRNEANLGMIENFRIVVRKARGKYFAWAGAHDKWHPDWLKEMVNILNNDTKIVLAYPLAVRISGSGERLSVPSSKFDSTEHANDQLARVRKTCKKMVGAGNIVYGLFRKDLLERCGIYPSYVMPDLLLLHRLAVYGAFKQVEKELWYRRFYEPKVRRSQVVKQQNKILFPPGKTPWYASFLLISHVYGLLDHFSINPPKRDYKNAYLGPYIAYLFLKRQLKRKLALLRNRILKRT